MELDEDIGVGFGFGLGPETSPGSEREGPEADCGFDEGLVAVVLFVDTSWASWMGLVRSR